MEKLEFDKFTVTINPEYLRFDESTLSHYIQTEGGYYDNYGYYLALSERNLQNKQVSYEKLYCERFVEAKDNGSSDKMAEAKAKSDVDVVAFKNAVFEAQYIVNRIKNHLKAWDKNHDNAQSLGHMQRKLMDRLPTDTISAPHGFSAPHYHDKDVEITVGSFEDSTGFDSNLNISDLLG